VARPWSTAVCAASSSSASTEADSLCLPVIRTYYNTATFVVPRTAPSAQGGRLPRQLAASWVAHRSSDLACHREGPPELPIAPVRFGNLLRRPRSDCHVRRLSALPARRACHSRATVSGTGGSIPVSGGQYRTRINCYLPALTR
jgi:hypothetical protein